MFVISKNYLDPITISNIEHLLELENKNHHIHIFIKNIMKKEIVGEIIILHLSKNQFNKFMNNKLIAISPNYRNDQIILSLLLEGLNNKLEMFYSNGIKILNMYT